MAVVPFAFRNIRHPRQFNDTHTEIQILIGAAKTFAMSSAMSSFLDWMTFTSDLLLKWTPAMILRWQTIILKQFSE